MIQKGFSNDDEQAQRRLIITKHLLPNQQSISIINGYFPQGDNIKHAEKFPAKRQFYAELITYLKHRDPQQHVIILGDFNISASDNDIGIGEANRKRWLKSGKCSFQPEERQWFQQLLDCGLRIVFVIVT